MTLNDEKNNKKGDAKFYLFIWICMFASLFLMVVLLFASIYYRQGATFIDSISFLLASVSIFLACAVTVKSKMYNDLLMVELKGFFKEFRDFKEEMEDIHTDIENLHMAIKEISDKNSDDNENK